MRGEHADRAVTGAADRAHPACAGNMSSSAHRNDGPPTSRWGVIPACAGSTGTAVTVSKRIRAHPRVRGEHGRIGNELNDGWGSSRVRGEHVDSASRATADAGSSPRARGAQPPQRLSATGRGLIPACAGSTASCRRVDTGSRAHPRVRGEHPTGGGQHAGRWGSSPRARGARRSRPDRRSVAGLIPACAGSTPVTATRPASTGAHPRVRGEHSGADPMTTTPEGSSPRARGARHDCIRHSYSSGLIPACAGST
ncbi:Domain of uncharacterised function (DUF2825) [Nocardia farcinica]|uniref:Domain of uncharacterized function (DUF2825) n=1 Tax=Nocardia farcinica TaxID=37329 RepID=A0A449H2V1_NOCFR|nr:Domain of uncharacterised function (DUF2825) [Nocardia farcinica]